MAGVTAISSFLADQRVIPIWIFISLLAYLLNSIGLIVPMWTKSTEPAILPISYFYGLWAQCQTVQGTGSTYCETWSTANLSEIFKASQAIGIIAFLSMTCAVLCTVMSIFINWKEGLTLPLGFILFYFTGCLTFAAVILFSQTINDDSTGLSWGFVMSVTSGVLSVLLGIYFTIIYFSRKQKRTLPEAEEKERIEKLRQAKQDRKARRRGNKISHAEKPPAPKKSKGVTPTQDPSLDISQNTDKPKTVPQDVSTATPYYSDMQISKLMTFQEDFRYFPRPNSPKKPIKVISKKQRPGSSRSVPIQWKSTDKPIARNLLKKTLSTNSKDFPKNDPSNKKSSKRKRPEKHSLYVLPEEKM